MPLRSLPSSPCLLALLLTLWLTTMRDVRATPPDGAASDPPARRGSLARALAELGLVDVQTVVPAVLVALKYARADNFMREAVYGEARECYLREEPAAMLARAQAELTGRRPGARLLLLDCMRPRAVQRRMWAIVRGTPMQPYVARPDPGSMHNHGAAVDIGLADEHGRPMDMGTAPDHFGELAQPRHEERFLREGKLTAEQVANRRLLREVMLGAGFHGVRHEWWHFEAFSVREIRRRYPLVEDFPRPAGPVAEGALD